MIKYIKHIIKLIKRYVYSFEAEPLQKFKEINNELINLSINSSKNNKKSVYYVIKRTPGAGLFSNFIFVLNHIKIADSCGFKPVVDMENFYTIYNEKFKINNTKNAWNYYFDNKSKYNLNEIYNNNKFILTNNQFSKLFSHTIDDDEFRRLFNKYFKINRKYIKFADEFKKKYFTGKMLAVHLRGTSYKTSANHPFPITIEQTLNLLDEILKKKKYSKIFLCTEDQTYFDLIKKEFKDKVIFLNDSYKSLKDDAFEVYPRASHRYRLGRDILIEALLISKCNGFVYSNTNVSEFVKFLDKKKRIEYLSIENDFNSQNEYIAKWLWHYKNIFPYFLGGFKSSVNVKKY